MIDTKQLIEYVKHPELALQNLSEVMDQLESQDESIQNYAHEALENCGIPGPENVDELLKHLNSGSSSASYWSSTLLGRLGKTAISLKDFATIQDNLCQCLEDESSDLAARERAAWALSEIGNLAASNRTRLQTQLNHAPPRLKRLLEAALSPST
jgi:HEAT repeat protein